MSEDNVKPVDPERAKRDAERAARMAARKAAQAAKEAAEAASAAPSEAADAEPAAVEAAEAPAVKPTEAAAAGADQPAAKPVDPDRAARDAARAERAAARAAAKEAEAGGGEAPAVAAAPAAAGDDAERAARDAARAERAAARAAAQAAEEAATPQEPSPNQPKLDRLVEIVKEHVHESAITEAYINERDRHLPIIVVDPAHWLATAELLRDHAELKLNYLRNVSGIDYETYLEVMYYFINTSEKQDYAVKVRTDRENSEIPSVASVWATSDWNEREIFDLLGVNFTGHPNMTRIMMPDDWVGHPLRKDYEPIDPEV